MSSSKMDVDLPDEFLRGPSDEEEFPIRDRTESFYNPCDTFDLPNSDEKQYKQQYGDLYFLRLATLKPAVEQLAEEAWSEFEIAGEKVRHVDRVLDVRQGELCWVAGTIYMDMPLKPNVLEDLANDYWIAAPPPREKYLSRNGQDLIVLEDESGRLRLIGAQLELNMLVTGCIVAVMGTENADGDFEVVDLKVPDLPRQPQRWERDEATAVLADGSTEKHMRMRNERSKGGKIALISGLEISSNHGDPLKLDLLMEFLLGELGGSATHADAARISRLIIAGNSIEEGNPLRSEDPVTDTKKTSKKYGYDASAYNPIPTAHLDEFLATLLPTIPITLLPGETDPANVSLPQQPLHTAMLPRSRNYTALPDATDQPGWFDSVTNPWQADLEGWRFMGNGGQPIDDVFKYVEGDDRLEMMECLLRWRCGAPTAPDTLWCYPFQDKDPFVIEECPHLFFVGNQPAFETTVVEGPAGQVVRLIALPKFRQTGEIILVDAETLEVEVMKFDVFDDV